MILTIYGGLERGIDLTWTLGIFKRGTEVIATGNYTKGSDITTVGSIIFKAVIYLPSKESRYTVEM